MKPFEYYDPENGPDAVMREDYAFALAAEAQQELLHRGKDDFTRLQVHQLALFLRVAHAQEMQHRQRGRYDEFWEDARKETGYDELLNEDDCTQLRDYCDASYENGGYEHVFNTLVGIVEFLRMSRQHLFIGSQATPAGSLVPLKDNLDAS